MAAVLLYFRKDLWNIARAWFLSLWLKPELRGTLDARMGWYIGLGTLPVGVFGLVFNDQIEDGARSLYLVGTTLIVLGLVLLLAEKVAKHEREIEDIKARDAVVIGFAQAMALIPGVSRSGATITAGLFFGFDRAAAARYSFLLSRARRRALRPVRDAQDRRSGRCGSGRDGAGDARGVHRRLRGDRVAAQVAREPLDDDLRRLSRRARRARDRADGDGRHRSLVAFWVMATRERVRLPPSVFRLPVEKIREGYYSDTYFNLTKQLLEADDHHPRVLMQVFQRKESILGGVDEAVAVLKQGAGHYEGDVWVNGWDKLEVKALHEGDEIEPWETVMTIEGDYSEFAHLETVYLGVMARRTLIMRNVREVVEAAHGKPILYFPARHDHWLVQTGDGWSAHIGGSIGVSTDAQASWWGGRGVGTVPHALIAAYGGDTALAARKFADRFGRDMNVTVLVDFKNDSVKTALEVADALGEDLWGVRLDTSNTLADESLRRLHGDEAPKGVAAELVELTRSELDAHGYKDVHIVVSGGFNAERIRAFEAAGVPVDSYGVGSSLIRGSNDFTADVVLNNGQPAAKVGREHRPNPRLEVV